MSAFCNTGAISPVLLGYNSPHMNSDVKSDDGQPLVTKFNTASEKCQRALLAQYWVETRTRV